MNLLIDNKNEHSNKLDPDVKNYLAIFNKIENIDFTKLSAKDAKEMLNVNNDKISKARNNKNVNLIHKDINGVRCLCSIPKNVNTTSPIILYLHGGGWTFGTSDTQPDTYNLLSENTNYIVIAIDYPLAPDNSLKDILCEIDKVIDRCQSSEGIEILKNRYFPTKIIMCGDSAGGHLTISSDIHRIKNNKKQVDFQIPIVPITNLTNFYTNSYKEFDNKYTLTKEHMKWYRKHLTNNLKENCIMYSPLHESNDILKKLTRTHIFSAECDVLHDDGKNFYEVVKSINNKIKFTTVNGQLHIFASDPYIWKNSYNTMINISNLILRFEIFFNGQI